MLCSEILGVLECATRLAQNFEAVTAARVQQAEAQIPLSKDRLDRDGGGDY